MCPKSIGNITISNRTIGSPSHDNRTIGTVSIGSRSIGAITLTDVVGVDDSSYQPESEAFFTAAGITDDTLKGYIDTLVLDLKGQGSTPNSSDIFSKLVALWPMMGGTSASTAIDLSGNSNSITWINSPTFASTGVLFNGSSQYGQTGIIPNINLTDNDLSIGTYHGTNTAQAKFSFGVLDGSKQISMIPRWNSGNIHQFQANGGASRVNSTNSDSSGLITGTRRSSTDAETYRNATSLGTETIANTTALPELEIYIGGRNTDGSLSHAYGGEFRGAFVSSGLTDNEVTDLNDAFQRFNGFLNRAV